MFHLLCVLFSAYFIRPFYKMMLGKSLALNDMESVVSTALWLCIEYTVEKNTAVSTLLRYTN